MDKKIKQLVELQNNLNNMTNGDKWIEGITNKGKEINWFTAILLETGEGIDSTPWKHWKAIDAQPDLENLKIEVVDTFHFVMSQLIKEIGVEDTIKTLTYFKNELNSIIEDEFDTKTFIDVNKKFMKITLLLEYPDDGCEYTYSQWIVAFYKVISESTLTFDELYNLYIMKNALNQIRQNNGYKEGTYKKEWEGKEDNVYLHELIKENPEMPFDEIMNNLQKKYNSIK
jgi:hypothetical protein